MFKDNGTYYLYGTTYDWNGFAVFTSTDMVNWSRHGLAWQKTDTSWGQSDFWAPEVMKAGNTYYLYYTTRNPSTGKLNVCVASASSPLGPFTDVTTPLMPATGSFLDGSPFRDPISGKYYLYVVKEDIHPSVISVTELADPPVQRVGGVTDLFTQTQDWEDDWVEAPYVFRRNGTYYMMYSGKAFWKRGYAVGYATASSPTGPWTKSATNPIIAYTDFVSGPGHNSVAESPDGTELFAAYHTHLRLGSQGQRQLAIDRLQFTSNTIVGQPDRLRLQAGAPTVTLQPLPSGAVPKQVGASDSFEVPTLDRTRWNIFGEEPTNWNFQHGQLAIHTQWGDIHQDSLDARNIFLQYAPAIDVDFETRVLFTPGANFEQTFLTLWENQSNFIRFSFVYANGPAMEVGVERNGAYTGAIYPNIWSNYLRLKIQKRGDVATLFAAGSILGDFQQVGPAITFPTIQPKIGLGAIAAISGARRTALFDYFNVSIPSDVEDWQLY